MRPFPYEVGYASGMSDNEMLSLSQDLEMRGWKREEEIISRAVDDYMTHCYRQSPARRPQPFHIPIMTEAAVYADDPWPFVKAEYANIFIRVPDAVDPAVARRLVEMQIREQMYEGYDARFPDND